MEQWHKMLLKDNDLDEQMNYFSRFETLASSEIKVSLMKGMIVVEDNRSRQYGISFEEGMFIGYKEYKETLINWVKDNGLALIFNQPSKGFGYTPE